MHEDGTHDLELLVLNPVLLIDPLQVFGKHSDALFQDLIIKRHLLLPSSLLLLITGGRTRSRRRCPIRPTLLQLITLLSSCSSLWTSTSLYGVVCCSRAKFCTIFYTVATAIVLRTKLDHVLMHQLLGLVDVGRLSVDSRD